MRPLETIEFTIQSDFFDHTINCNAAKDMTWGEWVESEYNKIGGEIIDGPLIVIPDGYAIFGEEGPVHPEDIIIAGTIYQAQE